MLLYSSVWFPDEEALLQYGTGHNRNDEQEGKKKKIYDITKPSK